MLQLHGHVTDLRMPAYIWIMKMRNFYPKLRKFERKLPIFCGRYGLVTDVTYELRMLQVKPADEPIRCQSADTCHGRLTDFTDDLRTIWMTYGRYGWDARVCACRLSLASAPSAYKPTRIGACFSRISSSLRASSNYFNSFYSIFLDFGVHHVWQKK